MLDRQVNIKETKVAFSTLERVLSEHSDFNGTMWNRLYDINRRSNRAAVEFVVRKIGNYPVSEAVQETVSLMRKRLER